MGHKLIGMRIDTVYEGLASIEVAEHGQMIVVEWDLFSHPTPEFINWIENGTSDRQKDESETKFGNGIP